EATPESGHYDTAQDVELSTSTTGATIYYTTDGTEPDDTSDEYDGAITVDESQVIKAVAIKDDWDDSEITEHYYVGDLTA
ncbi:MAG: chitobiase/beta-hexosaminidase C-terminal domain-containing protein, partial [Bacteroidota bacterium]